MPLSFRQDLFLEIVLEAQNVSLVISAKKDSNREFESFGEENDLNHKSESFKKKDSKF